MAYNNSLQRSAQKTTNMQNTGDIAEVEQQTPVFTVSKTMWNDAALMNTSWRTADMLSKAGIIPQQYRGKPGDCLIAIDMANRMGISPIMVMQSSQIVQGNFTWRGSACKALIDGCGKFRISWYVTVGTPGTSDWGCRLVAVRTRTGKTVSGPTVTWKMAVDEGWVNKNGSKWRTMPEIMMRYRAASFFAKTECPEVLMGFQTAEEQMDIIDSNYADDPESESDAFSETSHDPEEQPADAPPELPDGLFDGEDGQRTFG